MNTELMRAIQFYNMPNIDWLNYKVTENNQLTFHHIIKKCDGGKKELSNCALLTNYAHRYLHIIETKEIEEYILLNKMFELFVKQGHNPTLEQRIMIQLILEDFEKKHINAINSKGKRLIRTEYLKRTL